MILQRLLQILTGVLAGLAVVAVLVFRGPLGSDRVGTDGARAAAPYPAPSLDLVDVTGRPFALDSVRGEVALVFFGFSHCPDVCPVTLSRWSRALELLEAEGRGFQGIFVSVDPGRDTPEALAEWMERFHPSIVALTGAPPAIAATAEAWTVHVRVHDGEPDPGSDPHAGHGAEAPPPSPAPSGADDYLVEHSSRVFVVDPGGRVVETLPPYMDADGVAEVVLRWLP